MIPLGGPMISAATMMWRKARLLRKASAQSAAGVGRGSATALCEGWATFGAGGGALASSPIGGGAVRTGRGAPTVSRIGAGAPDAGIGGCAPRRI